MILCYVCSTCCQRQAASLTPYFLAVKASESDDQIYFARKLKLMNQSTASSLDPASLAELNALIKSIHDRLYRKRLGFEDFERACQVHVPGHADSQDPSRPQPDERPKSPLSPATVPSPRPPKKTFSCFSWLRRKRRIGDRVVAIT